MLGDPSPALNEVLGLSYGINRHLNKEACLRYMINMEQARSPHVGAVSATIASSGGRFKIEVGSNGMAWGGFEFRL